jgi:hypothetical protein
MNRGVTYVCVAAKYFFAGTALLAQAPFSTQETLPPSKSSVAIEITTENDSGLRVPVTIGASQQFSFLIDSASNRTVIAKEVAEKLSLPAGELLKVFNLGGVDKVPSVLIPDMQMAGLSLHDIHAPALARANISADGLVGIDMLQGQRMVIDFAHDTKITIVPSSKKPVPNEIPAPPGTIIVQAKSRLGELILTDAEIEGHHIAVIIDTGSGDSVGNSALRALVSRRIAHNEIKPVILVSVTGRQVPADYTQIGQVRIGGLLVGNLPIAFADAATFKHFHLDETPAILLGMDTLHLFDRITLDFPRRQVSFLLNPKSDQTLKP